MSENLRTMQTYCASLQTKSKATQKLFGITMTNFNTFKKIDFSSLRKYNDDHISDILQSWINWNHQRGLASSSIHTYFNNLRSYFWYLGIRLDWHNLQKNLKFPKKLYRYETPLSKSDIEKLVSNSKLDFKFQLLALLSSGMRVKELGQIKKEYLDYTYPNIMVRIPPEITKTGKPRITFFSKQVSSMIKYRIKNNMDIFCGNRTPDQSLNLILKRFGVVRKKSDMQQLHAHYNNTNRYHIHVHSLRAFFITRCNKIQFGLGHILAGHDFYMKQYNQYTEQELFEMYSKAESDFTFLTKKTRKKRS